MHRRLTTLGITMLIVLVTGSSKAEDLTFEKAMKVWSFMEGEWTVRRPDGTTETSTCKKAANASCYVLRTAGFHGIATFDGAEKKLLIFGSHSEGAYSLGHWTPKAPKEIEGSFTVTRADGSRDEHTGRFEILSKDEYTYTVDDDHTYRFTRK